MNIWKPIDQLEKFTRDNARKGLRQEWMVENFFLASSKEFPKAYGMVYSTEADHLYIFTPFNSRFENLTLEGVKKKFTVWCTADEMMATIPNILNEDQS